MINLNFRRKDSKIREHLWFKFCWEDNVCGDIVKIDFIAPTWKWMIFKIRKKGLDYFEK